MLNHLLISSEATALIKAFMTKMPPDNVPDDLKAQVETLSRANHVSFEQWWTLLEQLQATINTPALGLTIGECVKVEHFGCLGYLLKSSKDLEQALRCFERFQRLLYDGNRADLKFEESEQGEHVAVLEWQSEYGYSSQLSDELLISGLLKLAKTILGDNNIKPLSVEFTNDVDERIRNIYVQYFQCDITFSSTRLKVTFPAEYFSLPIVDSDKNLHHLMNAQAESLLEKAPNVEQDSSLLLRIQKTIVRALQEGEPTADYVANRLNMSVRTLHRKLRDNDCVFKDILKETRILLAKKYLKDQKISLPEVALMLGYSEQSAFNRAFKHWFGVTPKQYKIKNS